MKEFVMAKRNRKPSEAQNPQLELPRKFQSDSPKTEFAETYRNYPLFADLLYANKHLDNPVLELSEASIKGHQNRLDLENLMLEILASAPISKRETFEMRDVFLRETVGMILHTRERTDTSLPILPVSFRKVKASAISADKQKSARDFFGFIEEGDKLTLEGTGSDTIYSPTFLGSILTTSFVKVKVRGAIRGTVSLYQAVTGLTSWKYEKLLSESSDEKAARIKEAADVARVAAEQKEKEALTEAFMAPVRAEREREKAELQLRLEQEWISSKADYTETWDKICLNYAEAVGDTSDVDSLFLSLMRKDATTETMSTVYKSVGIEIYSVLVDIIVNNNLKDISRPMIRKLVDTKLQDENLATLFSGNFGYHETSMGISFTEKLPKLEEFSTLKSFKRFLDLPTIDQNLEEVIHLKSQLQVPLHSC